MQETYLRAFRAFHLFRPGTNIRAWLFTIMHNLFVDAALVVGNDPMPGFTDAAHRHLRSIPYISIAAEESDITRSATVSFSTATFSGSAMATMRRPSFSRTGTIP